MDSHYYCLNVWANDYVWLLQDKALEITGEAIEEVESGFVIRTEKPTETIKLRLDAYAKELSAVFGAEIALKFSETKHTNEDWISKYRDSIAPLECGKYYIRPSWHTQKSGKVDIVIDPALAFGSGHHPSTFGCLEALEMLEKRHRKTKHRENQDDSSGLENQRVLDVGCGSGILSICAKKSGAIVWSCDTDEVAVDSTKDNMRKNNVILDKVFLGSLYMIPEEKGEFDIIFANLLADIIVALPLEEFVKKDGYLVLSGILEQYIPKVLAKFKKFEVISREVSAEWATLVLQNKG